MFSGRTVAVVVPARDEERVVGETLRGIPAFVDRIYRQYGFPNDMLVHVRHRG